MGGGYTASTCCNFTTTRKLFSTTKLAIRRQLSLFFVAIILAQALGKIGTMSSLASILPNARLGHDALINWSLSLGGLSGHFDTSQLRLLESKDVLRAHLVQHGTSRGLRRLPLVLREILKILLALGVVLATHHRHSVHRCRHRISRVMGEKRSGTIICSSKCISVVHATLTIAVSNEIIRVVVLGRVPVGGVGSLLLTGRLSARASSFHPGRSLPHHRWVANY